MNIYGRNNEHLWIPAVKVVYKHHPLMMGKEPEGEGINTTILQGFFSINGKTILLNPMFLKVVVEHLS